MGEAILAGLLRSGRHVKDLVVAEKMPERARQLADAHAVQIASVVDAIENAEFVIIAVKPADVEQVVAVIKKAATEAASDTVEHVVVSVVAGMPISYYESRLPAGAPVIRAMPNAPALVRAGVTALAAGRFATGEQLADVSTLFDSVGGVLTVTENQLDAVTALSGSGPAYFFLFVEALVDAAVANGLTRATATDLAVQTMAGSAAMLLERLDDQRQTGMIDGLDTTPARLRATVTSPGGTTAAGLRELERGGLRAAVGAAIDAAKSRSEQLGITSE
jgi:pyrroline-5-carboxylate reductase